MPGYCSDMAALEHVAVSSQQISKMDGSKQLKVLVAAARASTARTKTPGTPDRLWNSTLSKSTLGTPGRGPWPKAC